MRRWFDIDELRREIAAQARGIALGAGLENVVTIANPDKRLRRLITIDVDAK